MRGHNIQCLLFSFFDIFSACRAWTITRKSVRIVRLHWTRLRMEIWHRTQQNLPSFKHHLSISRWGTKEVVLTRPRQNPATRKRDPDPASGQGTQEVHMLMFPISAETLQNKTIITWDFNPGNVEWNGIPAGMETNLSLAWAGNCFKREPWPAGSCVWTMAVQLGLNHRLAAGRTWGFGQQKVKRSRREARPICRSSRSHWRTLSYQLHSMYSNYSS